MSPQRLDRTLTAYRIGDPDAEYPIFDATGSTYFPGRWNDEQTPVIYAADHYSTSMLEKLVHANGIMPPNQHYVEITLPRRLSYEMVTKDRLSGWDTEEPTVSRDYGVQWARQLRSAILIVPSIVARIDHNIVINPAHAEFAHIETSLPTPVWWDERFFTQ